MTPSKKSDMRTCFLFIILTFAIKSGLSQDSLYDRGKQRTISVSEKVLFIKDILNQPSAPVLQVVSDTKGNTWINVNMHVFRCSDTYGWSEYEFNDEFYIVTMATGYKGDFWMVIKNQGYHARKFDGERWFEYDLPDELLTAVEIPDALIDRSGKLWIGVNPAGSSWFILKNDDDGWTKLSSPVKNSQVSKMTSIALDKDYHLLVGTRESGLFIYDGTEWQNMTVENSSIPENGIHDIVLDTSWNIWIGTIHYLSKLENHTWMSFSLSEGLGQPVGILKERSMEAGSNGTIWATVENLFGRGPQGVCNFTGQSWKHLTSTDGLLDNKVGSISMDSTGITFFASNNGLTALEDST